MLDISEIVLYNKYFVTIMEWIPYDAGIFHFYPDVGVIYYLQTLGAVEATNSESVGF